jgi:hypothetical protein
MDLPSLTMPAHSKYFCAKRATDSRLGPARVDSLSACSLASEGNVKIGRRSSSSLESNSANATFFPL